MLQSSVVFQSDFHCCNKIFKIQSKGRKVSIGSCSHKFHFMVPRLHHFGPMSHCKIRKRKKERKKKNVKRTGILLTSKSPKSERRKIQRNRMKEERKEQKNEGTKEERKETRREGRKRKKGRQEFHLPTAVSSPSSPSIHLQLPLLQSSIHTSERVRLLVESQPKVEAGPSPSFPVSRLSKVSPHR